MFIYLHRCWIEHLGNWRRASRVLIKYANLYYCERIMEEEDFFLPVYSKYIN